MLSEKLEFESWPLTITCQPSQTPFCSPSEDDWHHHPPYQFPGAAITKYNKLGDFKEQKCILSQSRMPEIQNGDIRRTGSFGRALREKSVHACLLSSGKFQWSLSFQGLYLHYISLCFHYHVAIFSPCVYVFSLLTRTLINKYSISDFDRSLEGTQLNP